MGLELQIPELPVLRPIRTAADSAGAGTTRPGNDECQDAADTGSLTPTAISPVPWRGGVDDDTGRVTPTAISPMPRLGDVVDDETGCITPTAMSSLPRQGGVDDDTDCVTPKETSFMPWQGGVDVDTCCVTPTTDASVLRPATVCPPAPRKPARSPAKRKRCDRPAPQRCFFPVSRDLSTVFVPRGAAASSPASSPEAKKIRVHAVG